MGHFSSWKTWKVEKFPKKKWHAIPMEAICIYIYQHLPRGSVLIQGMVYGHPLSSIQDTLEDPGIYHISIYICVCVCVSVFLFGAIYIFASYLWISLIYGNFYLNMLIERWILWYM